MVVGYLPLSHCLLYRYFQVGQIQGAHGIKGEVRVRSSTDFAMKRLCTPGVKFIKAPNRRFPRDVELIGGRWQKEDIFLMHFEVRPRDDAQRTFTTLSLIWEALFFGSRSISDNGFCPLTKRIPDKWY